MTTQPERAVSASPTQIEMIRRAMHLIVSYARWNSKPEGDALHRAIDAIPGDEPPPSPKPAPTPSPEQRDEWRSRCYIGRAGHGWVCESPTQSHWLWNDQWSEYPIPDDGSRLCSDYMDESAARAALAKAPPPPDITPLSATQEKTEETEWLPEGMRVVGDSFPSEMSHAMICRWTKDRDAKWRAECERLRRERGHWKANHDNQVRIKQALVSRPDLKDRAKRVQDVIAERDSLLAELAATQKGYDKITEELRLAKSQMEEMKLKAAALVYRAEMAGERLGFTDGIGTPSAGIDLVCTLRELRDMLPEPPPIEDRATP